MSTLTKNLLEFAIAISGVFFPIGIVVLFWKERMIESLGLYLTGGEVTWFIVNNNVLFGILFIAIGSFAFVHILKQKVVLFRSKK